MAEPTGVIRPQPRNAALGAIADALARAHTAAARVQFNPQVAPQFTLADLLPLEGAAGLMQDVAAYGPRALIKGGNVATGGLGTFRPDPRVLDVAEAATYASPLTRLARPAGRLAAQQVERAMSEGRGPLGAALAPVRPLNVMKPKGGNWLAGDLSPEAVAQRLKQPLYPGRMPFGQNEQEIAAALGVTPEEVLANADPSSLAINKWLDQKLAKYVRNEMATPEDPLRALAERGVLHFAPENVILDSDTAFQRTKAGFPRHGVAQSQLATDWEALADAQIIPNTAERMLSLMKIRPANPHLRDNPWLAKVPPETPVYGVADRPVVVAEGLGFDHLVDELRNVVRAGSDLPPELRLRPEQLSKVTVPQAVELVDRINKWRAAQKAEADLARSTNAATAEYKAYPTIPGTDRPNERGLRWVELRAPSNETMPLEERKALIAKLREEGGNPETWPREMLEAALKYEGEVMGHCVGGYCPDVLQGKSRIFSLRDARGEPHVTVEVRPGRQLSERDLPDDVRDMLAEQYGDASREEFEAAVQAYLRQRAVPDEIVQIKGKANRAPKEDYLPFVQDFVKSQQWGRIGDIQNTGLTRVGNSYLTAEELKPLVERASRFLEESPALERHRQAFRAWDQYAGMNPSETLRLERAAGESVHPTIPYTYLELRSILDDPAAFNSAGYDNALGDNLDRIETLRRLLSENPGYAEGGAVRAEFEYDPAAVEARAAALMEAIDAAA